MGFKFYKESYAGSVREISIGKGSKSVVVGGETCYPFFQFEGEMPNKPKVAMEIWDIEPTDWPKAALSHFNDVTSDPASWAKKCVDEYGAEIIVLQLKSIDPNGLDLGPETASKVVKKVLSAIDVPLIIWGIANAAKDEAVFKHIAEYCQEDELILGPVEDKNHKTIGAAAMGYGHLLISSSPIDVNLAKQVNILLENLGMQMDRVIIDPTTGGLGYGLEYSYSVMERIRMAALTQGDDKLQMPIINNLGNEVWKSKEARQDVKAAPLLGDPEKRGILMECVAAVAYLLAGSDILIMRHPEAIKLIKSYIDLIVDGGDGKKVLPIEKRLDKTNIDFSKFSPVPDLTLGTDDNNGDTKSKKTLEKPEIVLKERNIHLKKEDSNKSIDSSTQRKKEPHSLSKPDNVDFAKSNTENESNVNTLSEIKSKAKLQTARQIDKISEIESNKDIEKERLAKLKIDEKAASDEADMREKVEEELRAKRETEKLSMGSVKYSSVPSDIKKTPSVEQKDNSEKIVDRLMRIHRRISLYKW